MKKLNLVLLVFVVILASVLVLSISNVIAEDMKSADMKVEKDKIKNNSSAEKCNCSAMKKDQTQVGCGDPNCGTGKPCHCGEKCTCSEMKKDQAKAGCGDPNCGTGKPCHCGEKCMCSAKKDQAGKGMSCGCGMMGKPDGKMGGMTMTGSIVDQIMANADKIQFTQDQKDKLGNLVATYKKDMIRKKADLDLAGIDLEESIKKESPDLKVVADQFKKVSGLEADLRFSEFEFGVNVKALLTKEQKDALKMIMKHSS